MRVPRRSLGNVDQRKHRYQVHACHSWSEHDLYSHVISCSVLARHVSFREEHHYGVTWLSNSWLGPDYSSSRCRSYYSGCPRVATQPCRHEAREVAPRASNVTCDRKSSSNAQKPCLATVLQVGQAIRVTSCCRGIAECTESDYPPGPSSRLFWALRLLSSSLRTKLSRICLRKEAESIHPVPSYTWPGPFSARACAWLPWLAPLPF